MDCQSMAFVLGTRLFGGKLSPVVLELGRLLYLNLVGAAVRACVYHVRVPPLSLEALSSSLGAPRLSLSGTGTRLWVTQRFQRCDQHAALRAVLAAEVFNASGPPHSTTADATIHPPQFSPTGDASTSACRTAHCRTLQPRKTFCGAIPSGKYPTRGACGTPRSRSEPCRRSSASGISPHLRFRPSSKVPQWDTR